MPASELIAVLRKGAQGLDPTVRFLILDACDRLERQIKDNEILMQRIVDLRHRNDPKTNADRICAMTDEELVELLCGGYGGFDCSTCKIGDQRKCDMECKEHCKLWLQQPAEVQK